MERYPQSRAHRTLVTSKLNENIDFNIYRPAKPPRRRSSNGLIRVTVLPAYQVRNASCTRVVVGVQGNAPIISILDLDMGRLSNGAQWDILAVLHDLGQLLLVKSMKVTHGPP